MTNALKGALLSGLILPGLGQILLKRYMRGLAIILVGLSSLTIMIIKASQLALEILEKMDTQSDNLDLQAIREAASQAVLGSDTRWFNFCLLLIVVCWVFGVVDAYLIGKQMDARQLAPKQDRTPL